MSGEIWNEDKTLALVEALEMDPAFGMPTIKWAGSPAFVEDLDWIAGFQVTDKAAAEHNGKSAFRFALADEMGGRKIGRLVVAMDSMHDAALEWLRVYDSVGEMKHAYEKHLNDGFVTVPARVLMPGDYIKTVKPTTRRVTVDFVIGDSADESTDVGLTGDFTDDEYLQAWVKRYGPGCSARIVNPHGPGGGNPEVEFSGPYDAMRALLWAYSGEDKSQMEEVWVDWTPDEGWVKNVEIVPAAIRGGSDGLAVDLNTLKDSFLDMDLDETVLRRAE